MGAHGAEGARVFKAVGGGFAFKFQAKIDARFGRGFDEGELSFADKTHAVFFRRDGDVGAELADDFEELVEDGFEVFFAGVLGGDEIAGIVGSGVGFPGFHRDEVRVAVGETVIGFEEIDDGFVLFDFRGRDDLSPMGEVVTGFFDESFFHGGFKREGRMGGFEFLWGELKERYPTTVRSLNSHLFRARIRWRCSDQ